MTKASKVLAGVSAGIWAGLCAATIITGDVSVISQACAQAMAGFLLIVAALSK